ncbi:MAG: cryptochrome/photolyase family protein [Hoeflea sp.]|nr:cryptochrome/photolyase family protein [Hoeflea sp.]MBU4530690.1 cryptochrome/photolyase family protein [Alphaproteobacteria bacterium]MBU4544910.1 cryptochrome/photolyase family protein [Alphaproteobacteria bacterium]MBU4552053.1 cryptochrome/photolyase family protein [Alphaproteobacteria bacterium]MBV1722242.1 cryptochrome/photolyase family protein [Hoeflea sp.]MBV1761804.1 cryptochrome/photolyase family protein [Hoeflea sp.]
MSEEKVLRFILGDQLSRDLSSLSDAVPGRDVIFIAEVMGEATSVRHHKKKIAFLFSAMRHFANDLRADGFDIDYLALDDAGNPGTFGAALADAVRRNDAHRVVMTEPSEFRVLNDAQTWREELSVDLEIRTDTRFLASHEDFVSWAVNDKGQQPKTLRMEYFYREMRRRTGYLMVDGGPEGGQWNFDSDNRKALPDKIRIPVRPGFEPDGTTRAVMDLVARRFASHFGDLEPFDHPVTRADALAYLEWFIAEALPGFGDWQDAMKQSEPLLFHSHLSAMINCGLLGPRECCDRAVAAWREGQAPLNAVEGFVRQIIGWREFIRGVYWLKMPDYADANALDATRQLPGFFWTGDTEMNCLRQAVTETKANAYAHHIQRLMVLGNFCLLAGIDPKQVQEWFLIVYWDAYEWVEMPNVVGMALYADGGFLASKPYAASGAYINRMSDYCAGCRFDVKQKAGEKACPFNYLYWNFLSANEGTLRQNHRMGLIMGSLGKMAPERLEEIKADSSRFLEGPEMRTGWTHV